MLENWCSKSVGDPGVIYLVYNQLPRITQLKSLLIHFSQVLQTVFFSSKTYSVNSQPWLYLYFVFL